MKEPIISIICNTYNQEKYIADALDSFLMQELSVPFEILVHDDASTDHTPDIIREYEKKFPDIVKPIYQKENQYSKQVSITVEIQIPRAKGKYIAFCEGDDYWTDSHKLQLQYEFMERNLKCSACCHAYSMVDKNKQLIEERFDFSEDCCVPMERLIGNQLMVPHFATLFVQKEIMKDFQVPFLGIGGNDMTIRIYCATKGELYYFNKNMSCYRRFTEGSWTMRIGQSNEAMAGQLKKYIPFLRQLNLYTNRRYEKIIEKVLDERLFSIDLLDNNYKNAKTRKAYKRANIKRKLYICIGCICPQLVTKLRANRIAKR